MPQLVGNLSSNHEFNGNLIVFKRNRAQLGALGPRAPPAFHTLAKDMSLN